MSVTTEMTKVAAKGGVKGLAKTAKHFMSVRAPELAIGFGAAGLLTATGLAIMATVKAVRTCDADTEDRKSRLDDGEEIRIERTKTETLKLVWKDYVPAAIMASVSTAGIVLGIKGELGRSAAYAAALTMAEEGYEKYKQTVEETVSDKKKEEINAKWAQKRVDDGEILVQDRREFDENVRLTGDGNTLMYIPLIGLFIRSDQASVYKACNQLNKQLGYGEGVSLCEFLEELEVRDIPDIASAVMFDGSSGMLSVDMTKATISRTGEPCLVVDVCQKESARPYSIEPRLIEY